VLRQAFAALISLALIACDGREPANVSDLERVGGAAELEAHSAVFEQRIENPAPGVYVAIGYALANSIWIEGDDGAIVVDTTESRGAAEAVLAAFREVSKKPVVAIIYTHNHADHIMGASIFSEGRDVPIYAHETLPKHVRRVMSVITPTIETNAMRMFGEKLAEGGERIVNDGIGPELRQFSASDGSGSRGYLPPTQVFNDRLSVTISGIDLELIHSPGETDDQLVVWLPEQRVLLPGDNIYKAFPNLYTIRGTPYRDVRKWSDSVRAMAELKPLVMVPSHTEPVFGEGEIEQLLNDYADAIQFVHDQTVRLINQGMRPDEIVQVLTLPANLSNHAWLRPFYGTVAWSVRSVYTGYLGWFDGDSIDLFPMPQTERGAKLVALMGGVDRVLTEAETQLTENPQWAAELASIVLDAESSDERAKLLKATALRTMAVDMINPNARNWYLTEALELEGTIGIEPRPVDDARLKFAQSFPIENILEIMRVSLNPVKTEGVNASMVFTFPDQSKRFQLTVRNNILLIDPIDELPTDTVEVELNASDWVALITQHDSFPAALASGRLRVVNGVTDVSAVIRFLSMFAN